MAETRVIRMFAQDVELVERLTTLPRGMPFAVKLHLILQGLQQEGLDVDDVRVVVREELERLVGGPN